MRKLLSFFVLVLIGLTMFAQAPQRFTYQAVVRNESNTLVRGTVGVRVSILQGGVDGTVVYQETHTTTTNINGLMTLEIGGGTVVNGDFATIDWATGPYFLKTETDPDGGTNYTIEGTQQLLSVPYALYAGSAANSFSGDYNDLTNVPPMPQIPENVSAFNNDAGYITMDSIPEIPTVPTNVSAFTNDAGYITDTDVPLVPVNVSAFVNDAGYVTENDLPSYQVLSISNDTIYLTNGGYVVLPTGFSGDYNDLTNPPQIPTVPTQVSAFENDANYITAADIPTIPTNVSTFTNDAGYITMDSIPVIPTVPTNVSAFVNDAGYVTESSLTNNNYITQNDLITNNYVTEADIPTNVSAFTNDAGYITMDSIPTIPTVPTNVSAFQNDAGYITMDSIPAIPTVPTNVSSFVNDAGYVTESSLTTNNYITQNDLITNNYVTEADIPTNVSAFTNDAGYITMDSIPAIPTVPTNVSAFQNDAGYITMDSIPAIPTVPTNVSAFVNDAGYLTTATVQEAANIPTNVSAFNNDAGYITMDSIPAIPTVPTNVSAFTNDAGYLTSFTEQQVLTISNDTLFLTGGSFVKLPTGFDGNYNSLTNRPELFSGNYNDLTNKPQIPQIPANVSAFENDANYITSADVPAIPTNVSAFTNDAGYITMDFIPAIPTVPTNVSAFVNDAGYLTTATVQEAANIPTNVSAFNNDAGYITMDSIPTIPTVPTNVSAFENDANYITNAAIPTAVSAFENDAHYLTEYTEQQVLSIGNDTIYLTGGSFVKLPAGFDGNYNSLTNRPELFSGNYNDLTNRPELFSGNYNDLSNKPTIPTVPTNVSSFNNDANYITAADVPAIPANVSVFNNDAGYITMDSIPAIPTVPTNVSAFTNDVHYITTDDLPAYQVLSISNDTIYLSNGGYAVLPAGFDGNYNNLSNKPDLFSGSYNDLTDKPTIPTVPTNVSAFTNDANYITSADVPTIPTNVSAFTNDANYITNAAIPTNISTFTNDANYITSAAIPTAVSAFTNDAGYLTEYTEQQVLSISNDTIYLTGGSFAKLPAGFSGSYNDLTDRPDIPTVPSNVGAFENDRGYITAADFQNILDLIDSLQNRVGELDAATTSELLPIVNTVLVNVVGEMVNLQEQLYSIGNSAITELGYCWSFAPNPTINDSHESKHSGIFEGSYCDYITLGPGTHHIRAYATNAFGTAYGNEIVVNVYSAFVCGDTILDFDNNEYATISIGNQCWMKENLRSKHFANGSVCSWSYPSGVSVGTERPKGLYYNWSNAMNGSPSSTSTPSGVQGICPNGWHLPSDAEWSQLFNYVASQEEYWCSSTNHSYVKALAGGGWVTNNGTDDCLRCSPGYQQQNNNATGFSIVSPESNPSNAVFLNTTYPNSARGLSSVYCSIFSSNYTNITASIRCVKD